MSYPYQGVDSISLGAGAGSSSQAHSAIAIGTMAGNHAQGANSIVIGYKAGSTSHPVCSIMLNATGVAMNGSNTAALYIAPIRNFSTTTLLQYNPATAEIGYSNALHADVTFMSTLTVNSTVIISSITATNVGYSTLTGSTITVNTATVNSTLTTSTILSGTVGIGTAVPTSGYKLDVNGGVIMTDVFALSTAYPATNGFLRFTSLAGVSAAGTTVGLNYIQSGLAPSSGSAADLLFTTIYNGNEWMRLTAAGRLGIGIASPGYNLHVIGSIYASGDITGLSDKRYKTDVEPIQNALEKVAELKGCSYLRTDYRIGERQIGLIAQDVEQVFPEAVSYDTVNDKYSLNYGCLIAPVIEALKELKEENRALKAEIRAIKEHLLL